MLTLVLLLAWLISTPLEHKPHMSDPKNLVSEHVVHPVLRRPTHARVRFDRRLAITLGEFPARYHSLHTLQRE